MKKLYIFSIVAFYLNCSSAQWQSANGPYMASNYISMDFETITVSGNNLCAIIDDKVYVSGDNGKSWIYASYGLEFLYPQCIAYQDSMIVAGTINKGVYFSANHGSTYIPKNTNLPIDARIVAIAISGTFVLAAVRSGSTGIKNVYYTADYGNSWTATNGIADIYINEMAADGSNVYAATNDGMFMSSDSGLNWVLIGLPDASLTSVAVKGNRVFAGESNSGGSVYFTNNNGANWSVITNGLTSTAVSSIFIGDNYVYLSLSWDGVFRSNNNGASWTQVSNGLDCFNVTCVAARGNNVYAGCSDAFSVSANEGASWFTGLNTYNLFIKSILAAGTNIITSTNYGFYTSIDNGLNWIQFLYKSNTLATNDSVVFSGSDFGIRFSYDDGLNWGSAPLYDLPDTSKIKTIDTDGSKVFIGTLGHGVFYSSDNGMNWEPRSDGIPDSSINTIVIADSVIYAGTNNSGVFASYDYGLSWASSSAGIGGYCIQTMANYQDNIYAGTKSDGMYKSTDNGTTWIPIMDASSDTNILCVYTCGVNVFAGILGRGFYLSSDNGMNWASFNTGLINHNIKTITEDGTNIFVGTDGGGVWMRALSELPLAFSVKKVSVENSIICEGDSSTIKAAVVGGTPPYSYLWNNGNQSSAMIVNPATTTTYVLTVTDYFSNTTTAQATVVVNPRPDKPVLTLSGDTLISNASEGNVWLLNNQILYYVDTNKWVPFQSGYYSVFVIKDGCVSDTSDAIAVGFEDSDFTYNVSIYPSPAKEKVMIEVKPLHKGEEAILTIYDVLGEKLMEKQITESKTLLEIDKLNTGIYFFTLTNDKFNRVEKIIKE